MFKQILFNNEARQKLLDGINKATDAVKGTLGSKSRFSVIDFKGGNPEFYDDGISIIKNIELKDKGEQIGVKALQMVAEKTSDIVGDGTTTSMVLTRELVLKGVEKIKAGAKQEEICRDIKNGVEKVVEYLKKASKPISRREDMFLVANGSCLDKDIADIIVDMLMEVGKDGVIAVENSNKSFLEKQVVKGMKINRGYVSHYMATDVEKMEARLDSPYVLITDKKISSASDILPIMEKVARSGAKDLVIVAEDIDGEALATLILNKIKGIMNIVAVKAPGFGDNKIAILEDIVVLTGGELISNETGFKLEEVVLENLGRANSVIANKESTIIVGGVGDKKKLDGRIGQIKDEIEKTESRFDKESLKERLGKLSGGVGVIKVGATTEVEQITKKKKAENALNATRAAMEDGVVKGVGEALNEASLVLAANSDGECILMDALRKPYNQIVENSDDLLGDIKDIIDPTKVVITALKNASSVAISILKTNVIIYEEEKEGA